MKKLITSMIVVSLLASGCSSGGLRAPTTAVCAEVAEIMKGSGYMEGSRESLMNAVVRLAFYQPASVDDWVTYTSPSDGEYRPSLYDNDNAVYQNLYRLQAQAIDYANTRNSGQFYNEWKYFEKGCGFTTD